MQRSFLEPLAINVIYLDAINSGGGLNVWSKLTFLAITTAKHVVDVMLMTFGGCFPHYDTYGMTKMD